WCALPYHDALPVRTASGSRGGAVTADGAGGVGPTVVVSCGRALAHAVSNTTTLSVAASRGIGSTIPPRDRRPHRAHGQPRARCRPERLPCPCVGRSDWPSCRS